jgi:hypothetical protein
MKYVKVDGKIYTSEDPFECCFNYDAIICRYPGGHNIQCPNYKGTEVFPGKCPLREVKYTNEKGEVVEQP